MSSSRLWVVLLLIAAALVPCRAAADSSTIGRPVTAEPEVLIAEWRRSGAARHRPAAGSEPLRIALEEPTALETDALEQLGDSSGPTLIGWNQSLPATYQNGIPLADLAWRDVAGGARAAVVEVTSPGALALRVAISAESLPSGTKLWLIDRKQTFGPFDAEDLSAPNGIPFWSPVLEGEVATLEIQIPAGFELGEWSLTIPAVSHLFASPYEPVSETQSCLIDVACHTATWGSTAASVARLVFTNNGATYTCTGSLVADSNPSTATPYFLTARHCVGTQTVASTVTTFWFQQSSACGGASSAGSQLGGGASLLSVGLHEALDYSLLRLNRTPPNGATFAGWITNGTPIAPNDSVVGISHPDGGPKKVAFGNVSDVHEAYYPHYINVEFTQGGKSAGSSGSGLFTPQGQYIVGILSAGSGSCYAPPDISLYLPFEAILPLISQWLLGQALPGRLRVESISPSVTSWGEIGGPFSPSQWTIKLINTGGTAVQYTNSVTANWVSLSPINGSLAPGEAVSIPVSINGNAANLPAGTHTAVIGFANASGGEGGTFTVELVVSGPMTVTPAGGYSASGPRGGLGPSPAEYVLSNPTIFVRSYRVSTGQTWLALSSTTGSIPAGGTTRITVSLAPGANALAPGTYADTISFDNLSGAGDTTRPATLVVTPRSFSLSVTNTLPTSGRVTSNPAGIDCGTDCTEAFLEGSAVDLTAQPFQGSIFEGWSGAGCTGVGACRVTMSSASSVTASFRTLYPEASLSSGVPVFDSLAAGPWQSQWKLYYLDVSATAGKLRVELANLSADADLYVRFGERPTLSAYHCRPYYGGLAVETCAFLSPTAGRWWIGVTNWATTGINYSITATAIIFQLPFNDGFEGGSVCGWSLAVGSLVGCPP